MHKIRWAALWAAVTFLVLLSVGCAQYTNGDAQVDNQSIGAAQDIELKAAAGTAALAANDPATAAAALAAIAAEAKDIEANAAQQIAVHGGAASFQGLTAYSPQASAAARQTSQNDHTNKWYDKLWAGIVAGAMGAAAVIKIARSIPGVGTFFDGPAVAALDAGFDLIGNLHAKAQNGTVTATDVTGGVEELLKNPALAKYEKAILDKLHLSSLTTPTADATAHADAVVASVAAAAATPSTDTTSTTPPAPTAAPAAPAPATGTPAPTA